MALIPCPECSREISDKAKACPLCGYPLAASDAGLSEGDQEELERLRQEQLLLAQMQGEVDGWTMGYLTGGQQGGLW